MNNKNQDFTKNGIVGRCGLVGLFVMYKSHGAKGRWFASRPFFFFAVVTATMLRWQPVRETVQLRSGTPQQDDSWGLNEGVSGEEDEDDRQAKVVRGREKSFGSSSGSFRRRLNG